MDQDNDNFIQELLGFSGIQSPQQSQQPVESTITISDVVRTGGRDPNMYLQDLCKNFPGSMITFVNMVMAANNWFMTLRTLRCDSSKYVEFTDMIDTYSGEHKHLFYSARIERKKPESGLFADKRPDSVFPKRDTIRFMCSDPNTQLRLTRTKAKDPLLVQFTDKDSKTIKGALQYSSRTEMIIFSLNRSTVLYHDVYIPYDPNSSEREYYKTIDHSKAIIVKHNRINVVIPLFVQYFDSHGRTIDDTCPKGDIAGIYLKYIMLFAGMPEFTVEQIHVPGAYKGIYEFPFTTQGKNDPESESSLQLQQPQRLQQQPQLLQQQPQRLQQQPQHLQQQLVVQDGQSAVFDPLEGILLNPEHSLTDDMVALQTLSRLRVGTLSDAVMEDAQRSLRRYDTCMAGHVMAVAGSDDIGMFLRSAIEEEWSDERLKFTSYMFSVIEFLVGKLELTNTEQNAVFTSQVMTIAKDVDPRSCRFLFD